MRYRLRPLGWALGLLALFAVGCGAAPQPLSPELGADAKGEIVFADGDYRIVADVIKGDSWRTPEEQATQCRVYDDPIDLRDPPGGPTLSFGKPLVTIKKGRVAGLRRADYRDKAIADYVATALGIDLEAEVERKLEYCSYPSRIRMSKSFAHWANWQVSSYLVTLYLKRGEFQTVFASVIVEAAEKLFCHAEVCVLI
ncbi:MAG: hypothetical protein H6707_01955 [Deltaproteobacteria bacterium]|nr:hypothetical protein [Deltaproteobacteria bacterium]